MERPQDFLPAGAKIAKQLPDVDVVAVDIVQPDHVRVIFSDPFEEGGGDSFGAKAAVIQHPAFQRVKLHIEIRTDSHRLDVLTVGFHPSVGEHTGMSLSIQLPAFVRRDAARAAVSGHHIDKQILHPARLLFNQYFRQTILSTTPV